MWWRICNRMEKHTEALEKKMEVFWGGTLLLCARNSQLFRENLLNPRGKKKRDAPVGNDRWLSFGGRWKIAFFFCVCVPRTLIFRVFFHVPVTRRVRYNFYFLFFSLFKSRFRKGWRISTELYIIPSRFWGEFHARLAFPKCPTIFWPFKKYLSSPTSPFSRPIERRVRRINRAKSARCGI